MHWAHAELGCLESTGYLVLVLSGERLREHSKHGVRLEKMLVATSKYYVHISTRRTSWLGPPELQGGRSCVRLV